MCTQAHTYGTDVEVRGPLPGAGSFILSCGLLGSKSGHQAWQQALVIIPRPLKQKYSQFTFI